MNSKKELPYIIETLSELVDSLTEGERVTFNHIMQSIQVPKLAFSEVSSWCDECYTRNCIAHGEEFELILICWEKGQVTPIHDHGGEECWVRVIEGDLRETLYRTDDAGELKMVKSQDAKAGDVTYMVDFMGCHKLENISDKRSLTLHLYAKPIKQCNIYDEETETFVYKQLSYDTVSEVTSL